MLYEYVLSIVGEENAPEEQFTMDTITTIEDPELLKPTFLHRYREQLMARSHVAFLGLHAEGEHRVREVALYSCLGMWAGCIPTQAPALVYHHGSGVFSDQYLEQFFPAVLESLQLWLRLLSAVCFLPAPAPC
jgi:hypothetical protein